MAAGKIKRITFKIPPVTTQVVTERANHIR
jgi:hypothetical protein